MTLREAERRDGGQVDCGVALGIPEAANRRRDRWVYEAARAGIQSVKIKALTGGLSPSAPRASDGRVALPVTVDANGLCVARARARVARAGRCGPPLYQQPLEPDDLVGHARLSHALHTPVWPRRDALKRRARAAVMALDGPRSGTSRLSRRGLAECVPHLRSYAGVWRAVWAGDMPSRESDRRSRCGRSTAAVRLPVGLRAERALYGRNADVIKLTMGKDGPDGCADNRRAMLEGGRFRRGATARGVTSRGARAGASPSVRELHAAYPP